MLTRKGQGTGGGDAPSFFRSPYNWFLIVLFALALCLFALVHIRGTHTSNINYSFSLVMGLVPFFASFKGFQAARKWGGLQSMLGQAIFCLSLGLLFWSIGEIIWSYYNFVPKVDAPYPSFADVGFGLGVTFWIISAILLSKVAAVPLLLRKATWSWGLVVLLVLASTALSYYLVVTVAHQGALLSDVHDRLKVFLDIYYPFADFVSLTLAGIIILVSGRYVGGRLRAPILCTLLGLGIMYAGDIIFSYTTTVGTFYNSDFGDFVLLTGITTLSLSLLVYAHATPRTKQKKISTTDAR